MSLKSQDEINEKIREAYGFIKYTERIKEEAPWAYAEANARWLKCIKEGINLIISSEDIIILSKKMVTIDTEMRHSTYTAICSQGPTEREKWLFPWE